MWLVRLVLPMLTSTDVVRYSSASGSELSRKPELNLRYTSINGVVVSGMPQAYHSFNILAPSRILRTTRTMIDRARMVEGQLTATHVALWLNWRVYDVMPRAFLIRAGRA